MLNSPQDLKNKLNTAKTRFYADILYDFQKIRIQSENRIGRMERDFGPEAKEMIEDFQKKIADPLRKLEALSHKDAVEFAVKVPIYDWLLRQEGIGERLAIALIAYMPDFTTTANYTISSLWQYCGFGIIPICLECKKISYKHDDHRYGHFLDSQVNRRWQAYEKRKSEEKLSEEKFKDDAREKTIKALCQCENPVVEFHAQDLKYYKELLTDYNPTCKTLVWKVAWCFTMQKKGFYKDRYQEFKEKYAARDDLKPLRRSRMVKRAVAKLFVSHYWMKVREYAGLPVGKTYLQERYEREGIPNPHKFIEPPQ